MIAKVTSASVEQVFEKEITIPVRKERFTIKQLDAQIAQLQARITELETDKADALAIKEL